MARKFCPACNRLNGGSAIACPQCGHAFDAASIPSAPSAPSAVGVAKPAKVCLVCGTRNLPTAQVCDCREPLDTNVDDARAVLQGRRTNGAILAGVSLAGVAGLLVAFFVLQWIWPWILVVVALAFVNGVRIVVSTNKLLAALPASLPKATLREPRK